MDEETRLQMAQMAQMDPMNEETTEVRPRRKRTGRKRTVFQAPKRPALAVRDLWNQAGEQEQRRAHEMCVLILEYWLGKKSKQELSKTLGVAPLRVWQLSQQAVSGMLAGLLKQPRRRRSAAELALLPPEEDPRLLKKRVRELETRLARTEDLVRVLRTAPWVAKKDASPTEVKRASRAKKNASPARRRNAQASRRAASVPSAQPSGAGGAGGSARAE